MKHLFTIAIVLTALLTSCKQKVDLLVFNAKVYTVNDTFEKASAFAVDDGRIVAIGNDDEIRSIYTSKQTIDVEGMAVFPGFNDGHSHFLGYGLSAFNVDLSGTRSFNEVIERVVKHHEQYPSEWITGRGWDQNDWDIKEFPTKEKLDRAFPNKPVVLRRVDGHALIANSEAMKRAEITAESYVAGGDILKVNGESTGIFIDNAMGLIGAAIPQPSTEKMVKALLKAQEDCFTVGLTTVTDAGLSKRAILLIDSLQKAGTLDMRVYAMMNPSEENFEYFFTKEPIFNGKLTVSSVKLYIDGALGSRGALLLAPYSDDPGNFGLQLNAEQYYYNICNRAYNAGFQVNTHAIGDSGNRIMLNTYARFLGGQNDRRWRVEHAQIVHPGDFKLFKEYSIIPSVQSTHCTSDMYWADERLGEDRLKTAYAYKELLKQNGWLVNGTDFPVEGIDPLHTFYAAVARKDLAGWPEGGFQLENALSREEALRSITIWPAKGSFDEDFKGSLEVGKAADFVILDQDIMQIDEEALPSVRVLVTYLGGELMYKSEK